MNPPTVQCFIRRMRIDMYGERLNSKDELGYIVLGVDDCKCHDMHGVILNSNDER